MKLTGLWGAFNSYPSYTLLILSQRLRQNVLQISTTVYKYTKPQVSFTYSFCLAYYACEKDITVVSSSELLNEIGRSSQLGVIIPCSDNSKSHIFSQALLTVVTTAANNVLGIYTKPGNRITLFKEVG